MKKPTGYLVYSGPSRIDQKPILGIAVLNSDNEKTGNMIQLYIINADQSPMDAAKANATGSICGTCPMRKKMVDGTMVGACYVNLGQGPRAVWEAYKLGKYPVVEDWGVFAGRAIRFGAYGEPVALPIDVLENMANVSIGWTGYTHRWIREDTQDYKRFCVASCDSEKLAIKAKQMGWSTFRHKALDAPLLENEVMCPADPATGVTCLTCRKCDGKSKTHVVIDRHGPTAMHYKGA